MRAKAIVVPVICTLFLFGLFSPKHAGAQISKWGDITESDLQMTSFESDSSASAVVLFDYGRLWFEDQLEYFLERHLRIKILNESGYDHATVSIPFNDEYGQDIDDLEAVTYYLEEGKLKKKKLRRRDTFEEELINGYRQVKFTMPALKPGSVIEYRYKKEIADYFLFPDWGFNKSIPVRWSEFRAEIPTFVRVSIVSRNIQNFYKKEVRNYEKSISYTFTPATSSYVQARQRRASIKFRTQEFRWVMKDLPALKTYPYLTTIENYTSKIFLQFSAIHIPNQVEESYAKTWEEVIQTFLNDERFGEQIARESWSYELVNGLTGGTQDKIQVLEKLYRYVSDSFIWVGKYGLYADRDMEDVSESKRGSGPELNLLLTRFLREADIIATPVLISTRNNGRVLSDHVLPNQFNHVVVLAIIGGNTFLLDATADRLPVTMLPERDLNGKGLLVRNGIASWIDLENRQETEKNITVEITMQANGSIDGSIHGRERGYYAAEIMRTHNSVSRENLIKSYVVGEFTDVELDSFTTTGLDSVTGELTYEVGFSSGGWHETQVSDSLIYLNPLILIRQIDQPFKQPQRDLPVEFPYGYKKQLTVYINLPDGHTVEEIPEEKSFVLPGNSGNFQRKFSTEENRLTLRTSLEITKNNFSPGDYSKLREFFSQVVSAHNERVIVKKGGI